MFKVIYNRIRLFKLRQKEPYPLFFNILGFFPNDITLYEQAFLHRSSSVKSEKGRWINNERLEFLGDAILDAIVADVLFHEFEAKKEGFLTNTRSKIVQRENLNKLALNLGLDKLIVSSTRTNSHNTYIYGNAFEAFIGAIYVDQGYEVCKKFVVERVIRPYINLNQVAKKEVNFKSKLIEWSQKHKVEVRFSLIESFTDNDNNPVFQTQVLIADHAAGIGIGYSKKESQQNAAKMALKKIQACTDYDHFIQGLVKEESETPVTNEGKLNQSEEEISPILKECCDTSTDREMVEPTIEAESEQESDSLVADKNAPSSDDNAEILKKKEKNGIQPEEIKV